MNSSQKLLMYTMGEASMWESALVLARLGLSSKARNERRRYLAVSEVFAHALGGSDELYHLQIGSGKTAKGTVGVSWLLLAGLIALSMIEWRTLTGPALHTWVQTVMHTCGLQ